MSIASEINRIQNNVDDSFEAVASYGVTINNSDNSDQLATRIYEIGDAMDSKFVRYDAAQSLNTTQKTQATSNIGALPLSGGTLTGNLIVGSTSSNKNLTINGNITSTGTITGNSLYTSSDISLKENIKPISESIKEFNWKETGKKSYGFIAQELELTNPELVHTKENGLKAVNYEAALCMIIAKLENRIKILEEKLNKLE